MAFLTALQGVSRLGYMGDHWECICAERAPSQTSETYEWATSGQAPGAVSTDFNLKPESIRSAYLHPEP